MSELTAEALDQIDAAVARIEALVEGLPEGDGTSSNADLEARRTLARLAGNHRRVVELVKDQADSFLQMARLLASLELRIVEIEKRLNPRMHAGHTGA